MKQIMLERYYPQHGSVKAYLVDETHAILSIGGYVSLAEVIPTEDPELYKQAAPSNFVFVATGGRTISALKKIVKRLQEMSAYTLLTQHYDMHEQTFYINKRVEKGR